MQARRAAMEEGMERLRALGYKLTPQRCAVLRLFTAQATHMTAQEVWSQLEHVEAGLSRATVYNTLEVLEQAGVLLRVQAEGGQTYFDPRLDPHHHAQCGCCGQIFDLELAPISPAALMPGLAGFAVDSVALWLRGTCAACLRGAAAAAASQDPIT